MWVSMFLLYCTLAVVTALFILMMSRMLYDVKCSMIDSIIFVLVYSPINGGISLYIKQTNIMILNMLKPILILALSIALMMLILRFKFLKSVIVFGILSIVYAVSESIVFLILGLIGIDTASIAYGNNYLNILYANIVVNIVVLASILAVKHIFIKFFRNYILLSLNTKTTIIVILMTFLIIIANMSYYYLSIKNEQNIPVFFIITGLMIFYAVYIIINLNTVTRLKVKEKELEQQKFYNGAINKTLDNLKRFKHGYNNNLNVLYAYAKKQNYEKLMEYFNEIVDLNTQLSETTPLNIRNAGLFGLISSKIAYAEGNGVSFKIESNEIQDIKNVKISELCEILGIFIDNAIEAASESESKLVKIVVFDNIEHLYIQTKNSYRSIPDMSKITEKGFSTKGEGRGMGLWIVDNIVKSNKSIIHNTFLEENMLVQELIINQL